MTRIMFRYRILQDGQVVGVGIAADPARTEYRFAQEHGKEKYAFQWLQPHITVKDARMWEREEVQKLHAQGIYQFNESLPPAADAGMSR